MSLMHSSTLAEGNEPSARLNPYAMRTGAALANIGHPLAPACAVCEGLTKSHCVFSCGSAREPRYVN